jgi:CMP-N-acetylneuraminic acid synthetase
MKNKIIVIIPARLGSQRLKYKNILPIKNIPMVAYVAREAKKSKFNPTIFVSSESEIIEKICVKYDLNFIKRPKKLARKFVEKQEVIVSAAKHILRKFKYKPEIVVSLQCNSPEFKCKDLDNAIKFFKKSFPGKEKKELISVGRDNMQNAAFRIMTWKAVFQKSLSTNISIFYTDYTDIHYKTDYLLTLKKIK